MSSVEGQKGSSEIYNSFVQMKYPCLMCQTISGPFQKELKWLNLHSNWQKSKHKRFLCLNAVKSVSDPEIITEEYIGTK